MPDYSLFGDEHVRRYEATGGKIGHDWNNTSCLVLHTIGRKSGESKKFPLIYGRDGNNYLIVASKGGAPDHPGWYKNLLAHPDVKIQVWDKVIPVRARTATAEEKKRVWPIMTAPVLHRVHFHQSCAIHNLVLWAARRVEDRSPLDA